MVHHIRRTAMAPLVCAVLGCGAADSSPPVDLRVAVDTVNGVEVVRSDGPSPTWSVEKLFTVGEPRGGVELAPDEFAWVSSVTRGPDGLLYVADIELDHIIAFDSTGDVRSVLGRKGEGPGEFESNYSLAWLADTLVTLDIGNARLGRYSDGNWHGYVPAIGRLVASPVTFRLYQVGPREVYQWAYRPDEDVVEATWRGHGIAAGLEWRRESLSVPSPYPDKVVCTMGRGFSWFDHPYVASSLTHPGPNGTVYAASSSENAVLRLSAEGDTLQIIDRDVQPASITDAEWRRIETNFEGWLEDKDRSQCEPRSLTRPETKPSIAAIQVDVAGRLWIEWNLEDGTSWEIFSPDGLPLGSMPGLEHDRQRSVPWLGLDHIAWITRDELDLPRVHLARIVPD